MFGREVIYNRRCCYICDMDSVQFQFRAGFKPGFCDHCQIHEVDREVEDDGITPCHRIAGRLVSILAPCTWGCPHRMWQVTQFRSAEELSVMPPRNMVKVLCCSALADWSSSSTTG